MRKVWAIPGAGLVLITCSYLGWEYYEEDQSGIANTTYCDGVTPKPEARALVSPGTAGTVIVEAVRSERTYRGMDYSLNIWGNGAGLLDLEIGKESPMVLVIANERMAQRQGCPVFGMARETANGESPLVINHGGTPSGPPMIRADRTNAGFFEDALEENGCIALMAKNAPLPVRPSVLVKIEGWVRHILSSAPL